MAKITVGGSGRIHSGGKISQEIQEFSRANHNLSKIVRDTLAPGVCVPIYTKRALPGDTFDIENIEAAIYTDPTERAMYGGYILYIEVYFAPTRLYQAWLHNNKEYIGEDMSTVKLPLMDIKTNTIDWTLTEQPEIQQIHPSSLLAHLGVRTLGQNQNGYTPDTPYVRAIFNAETMLGYYDIGKNYYFNRQEKQMYFIDYSEAQAQKLVKLIEQVSGGENKVYTLEPPVPTGNGQIDMPTSKMNAGNDITLTIQGENLEVKMTGSPIVYKITMKARTEGGVLNTYVMTNDPDNPNHDNFTINYDNDGLITSIAVGLNINTPLYTMLTSDSGSLPKSKYLGIDVEELEPVIGANIASAPITNFDDMREDILAAIKSEEAFVIDKNTYAPYGNNFIEKTKKVQTKENPNTDITRECITSYYPLQGMYLCTYKSDKFNNWLDSEYIDKLSGVGGKGLLDVTEGLNLNVLQMAMKIYNQTAKIAISNRSYEDWMYVIHGQQNASRCEIPRYEGGFIQNIDFFEMNSTAPGENAPTGSIVANARVSGKPEGGKIVVRCEEAGNIIAIARIVPRLVYSQGNNPDLDLKTMDDLHQPDLDGIGYQDLLTERFAAIDTRRDENGVPTYRSIGKQPAYIDYMTDIDEAYGDFCIENNKMSMTLNRRYRYDDQTGNVTDATTYIDPEKFNYVWAGIGRNTQHFDTSIKFNITARRKVSTRQMPQFNI